MLWAAGAHQPAACSGLSPLADTASMQHLPGPTCPRPPCRFHQQFLQHLSLNGTWWFAFLGTSRWIGVRLDTIAALTLTAAVLLAMAIRSWVQPQLLGLALTHVLSLTGTLQWWVRQTVEVSAPRSTGCTCIRP
jgi:hypothetical protein